MHPHNIDFITSIRMKNYKEHDAQPKRTLVASCTGRLCFNMMVSVPSGSV